jgi:O-antigen/teichoic acid export membrane protein
MTDSVAPKDSTSAAAPGEPLDASGMNRLVSRNIFSSIGAKLLYLVTRFFLPPIILAYISLEEYGIWAMCFILIGYLGMSAFGVSNVYIRYVAQYHAQGEEHRIGAAISSRPG